MNNSPGGQSTVNRPKNRLLNPRPQNSTYLVRNPKIRVFNADMTTFMKWAPFHGKMQRVLYNRMHDLIGNFDNFLKNIRTNTFDESNINKTELEKFIPGFRQDKYPVEHNLFTSDAVSLTEKIQFVYLQLYYSLLKTCVLDETENPTMNTLKTEFTVEYVDYATFNSQLETIKDKPVFMIYNTENDIYFVIIPSALHSIFDKHPAESDTIKEIISHYFHYSLGNSREIHSMIGPVYKNNILKTLKIGNIGSRNSQKDLTIEDITNDSFRIIFMLLSILNSYIINDYEKDKYYREAIKVAIKIYTLCILNSSNLESLNSSNSPSNVESLNSPSNLNIVHINELVATFTEYYTMLRRTQPIIRKINSIAYYIANNIFQQTDLNNITFKPNKPEYLEYKTLSKVHVDSDKNSGKQMLLGPMELYVDQHTNFKEYVRSAVGQSVNVIDLDPLQLFHFNWGFNKLMTLCISRINLLFPARLYYMHDLNLLLPHRISIAKVENAMGVLNIGNSKEPLYFSSSIDKQKLRYYKGFIHVSIFDYRRLHITPGTFKPNFRLTYDEINILLRYLKMSIYKTTSSGMNIYFISYFRHGSSNRNEVAKDNTFNRYILENIFGIIDKTKQTSILTNFEHNLNGMTKNNSFRSRYLPEAFQELYKLEVQTGGNKQIIYSKTPDYNSIRSTIITKYFNTILTFDELYTNYKHSIIEKIGTRYLNYPYAIYIQSLKKIPVTFKEIKFKRIKSIENWLLLFNYNYMHNIINTISSKNIDICIMSNNIDQNTYLYSLLRETFNKVNINVINYIFTKYTVQTFYDFTSNNFIKKRTPRKIKNDKLRPVNDIKHKLFSNYCNYNKFKLNETYDIIVCNIVSTLFPSAILLEYSNINLYLDQLIIAILHLNEHGHIHLRIDGLKTKLLVKIIYNVSLVFDDYVLYYPLEGALYSGRTYIWFKSFNKKQYNVDNLLNKLKNLSDAYNDTTYNALNMEYKLSIKKQVNYISNTNIDLNKLYLNDSKDLIELPTKDLNKIKKFNDCIGLRRLIFNNNMIYFIKYIVIKPNFNKTDFIKKQYHKQIICSYLYSLKTPSKFLRTEFNKLNFNITDKKIFESIYQLPAICEDLIDYKCYNQLIINQFKNKLAFQTIKEKLDNDLYDPITDYIIYFNEFYKVHEFEKLVSTEQKINDVLKFTKKIKISKASKISKKDILYLHDLLKIKKVLPNISNKDITVLFKLDILEIAKKTNNIQDSITLLLYYFKKVHLWKSSFDFNMSTIYFIGSGFEPNDKLTKTMIEKCRHNISKYINVLLHNINQFYVDRDMIPTIYLYIDILSKKHRTGLIKYAKRKRYIK